MEPSKVPRPVDFLAEWGLSPTDEEADRLFWVYELQISTGGVLVVAFSGVERWMETTIKVQGVVSSSYKEPLIDLRFVDSGGTFRNLLGRFDLAGRKAQVKISNAKPISVQWRTYGSTE